MTPITIIRINQTGPHHIVGPVIILNPNRYKIRNNKPLYYLANVNGPPFSRNAAILILPAALSCEVYYEDNSS